MHFPPFLESRQSPVNVEIPAGRRWNRQLFRSVTLISRGARRLRLHSHTHKIQSVRACFPLTLLESWILGVLVLYITAVTQVAVVRMRSRDINVWKSSPFRLWNTHLMISFQSTKTSPSLRRVFARVNRFSSCMYTLNTSYVGTPIYCWRKCQLNKTPSSPGRNNRLCTVTPSLFTLLAFREYQSPT